MAGIKLNLLGGFEATLDEVAPFVFDSDKDRALFIYLVASPNYPIRRGSLAGLFWPEHPEVAARHSLCQAIYSLRKQFHNHFGADPFEVTPQTLLFRLEDPSGVDFYVFDQLIQGFIQHWSDPDLTSKACLEKLEQACAIYRGDFCAGLSLKECDTFEEWLCLQREVYHLKFMRVLEMLIEGLCLVGDLENALFYAYKKVFQDPYNESSQRQVILLLTQLGQRKQAIEHFENYQRVLTLELHTSPSNEMIIFCQELLSIQKPTGFPECGAGEK
jgi:DNA-binding SARP family transcriptional activator